MNKIALYTVITNNYDTLRPIKKERGIDYICFTDNPNLKSSEWNIIVIPQCDEPIKLQRSIKILSHQFTKGYDTSVYIDANFVLIGSIHALMSKHYRGGILTCKHNARTLISEEAKQILLLEKDTEENVNRHLALIDFVPDDCGMYASGFMIRDKSEKTALFETRWEGLMKEGSHRDQLSMGPAAWLTDTKINTIERKDLNRYFIIKPHLKS
jgi:hypothetical protein